MNLTDHFTLEELTFSDLAKRLGIDNTPTDGLIETLRRTAQGLERIRGLVGTPIHINSGYRCEALEKVLTRNAYSAWCIRHGYAETEESWRTYFSGKQHPKGEAVDTTCKAHPPREFAALIAENRFNLAIDQVILEFGSWVHVSFTEAPRHAVLTIDHEGTRMGIA